MAQSLPLLQLEEKGTSVGGLWDRDLCSPGSRNGPAELQECHIDFINLSLTHTDTETNKTSLPKPARFGKDFASKHCLNLVQSR